jgi:hypothetical protein
MDISNCAHVLNLIENLSISNVFEATAGFGAEKRWGNEAQERLFLTGSDAGSTPHFQPPYVFCFGSEKWLISFQFGF